MSTATVDLKPFESPVNPSLYPLLSVGLCLTGLFFLAWFFVYVATTRTAKRSIAKELSVSLGASIFLGLGVLFLLLWTGVYV